MNFVPGDFYTVVDNSSTVLHYSNGGTFIESYTVDSSYGRSVRGIAFSSSGLLYATMVPQTISQGFTTISIDGTGTVTHSYGASDFIAGSGSSGKLNFGPDGRFFVAANNHVVAFTPGNSIGTSIFSASQICDVKPLANGNLLVLSDYNLREITSEGALVRDIVPSIQLVNAQGIEFDPNTNKIYLTMLGFTGQDFRIMQLNGTTGQVEINNGFHYGSDLVRTSNNTLLVGSTAEIPRFYDLNLNQIDTLGTEAQSFVTQMPLPVPEPALITTLLMGVAVICRRRKRPEKLD